MMMCASRRLMSMPKNNAESAAKGTGFREIVGA